MNNFQKSLAYGKVAEADVTLWLKQEKEWCVLPVYDISTDTGKGPRLLTLPTDLVVPDLLVMREGEIRWIESKRKTKFVWHGIAKEWRTGIDLKHYFDYIQVEERTGVPVWLFFLHEENAVSDADRLRGCREQVCPTGLFGAPLWYLRDHEAECGKFTNGWRNHPMVYWNHATLRLIASLEEVHVYRVPAKLILAEEEVYTF